jgi:hypothetical protein
MAIRLKRPVYAALKLEKPVNGLSGMPPCTTRTWGFSTTISLARCEEQFFLIVVVPAREEFDSLLFFVHLTALVRANCSE